MASFKYKFKKGSTNQAIYNSQQGGISASQKYQRHNTEYCADYKMDIKPKGTNRILWMHKDESEQS